MKRLRIEHETGFSYQGEVSASYNEARMLPGTTDSQFVLSSSLDIEPSTSVNSYVDYFGTRVSAFDVLSRHTDLKITARSLVEVRPRPIEHSDISWERLSREAARTIETVEQMVQSARTAPHPEVVEIAKSIAARHTDPSRAAHDIAMAIGDAVEYVTGVTGVHSTGAEAWEARKGVCQDLAHIVIGALRAVGIPARYVSGYLHPKPQAEVGVAVEGESHAWVEWFSGEWQGFDPTNNIEIGDRHVLVGRARDYNDVPPLRGVYGGTFKGGLNVNVTITREA
ncbi:transglutaminase-like putative cysteine protease [Microbacterium endophyticum]|uniref:Transglutaminase-like putative cysteine protease n=1 Tax=Microbacterium endophyticum TaxID=1526412 RepID=A0A7W4V2T7_9MICO|nr:transglutaminase family protein [Microbacterium endophyticum]MBB2975823.1 transglutaminase-like putative cysteine protease [Microbacterium endophyticum]NIK36306.1 transglutaminase-like putative cysteine protease [Microbacterium endophyticum]